MRIALLTEIPAPFRIPLFNTLHARDSIELRVLFLAGRDPKRPYPNVQKQFTFPWRTLRGRHIVRGGRWVIVNSGVILELTRFRPEVLIVGGWNQPAFWQAALWARAARRPLVLWVESTARDDRPGSGPLEWAKRRLIRSAAGFLVPGAASADYLRSLGAGDRPVGIAPNAVDLTVFRDEVARLRRRRTELRAELGLTRPTFLSVARLDEEKGLDVLLKAATDIDADFVLAGTGPLADALRAQAPPNVRLLGWLPQEVLVRWYAAADAFVLPSRSEQWGMVLNEASAAGLPLVSTDAAGAAHDLIEDGVNGFRVPVGDAGALATTLMQLAEDEAFRRAAGTHSSRLAERYTPAAWALGVADLAQRVRELGCRA